MKVTKEQLKKFATLCFENFERTPSANREMLDDIFNIIEEYAKDYTSGDADPELEELLEDEEDGEDNEFLIANEVENLIIAWVSKKLKST